jgi:tRNA dimethylallyltransferase
MGHSEKDMNRPLLVVVAGPTASGKTAVAIQLARFFNTEILSFDSRQCFTELKIGVARPSDEELSAVPHHFIASHSIHDPMDAAGYEKYALGILSTIFTEKKIAIAVGGTGLYIKALCEGVDAIPEIPEQIRSHVRELYAREGMDTLLEHLKIEDPQYFKDGELKNPQRVMRALEVSLHCGTSIRNFQTKNVAERNFRVFYLGMDIPKEVLHQRIDKRVDTMVSNGLLEEARDLFKYRHLNALQTVGYKEFFDYFDGKTPIQEAIERIKIHTRQYAKRQITWFKKNPDIHWVQPENTMDMRRLIEQAYIQ